MRAPDIYCCHVLVIGGDGKMRPLKDIQADVIEKALEHTRGNLRGAARELGIGRSTIYRRVPVRERRT